MSSKFHRNVHHLVSSSRIPAGEPVSGRERRASATTLFAGKGTWAARLMVALAIMLAVPAFSQEPPTESAAPTPSYLTGGKWAMVRFEFDNDTFLSSDDVFSAGWSLQLHSGLKDRWDGPMGSWLGRFPLLGDDGEGGRVVRRSFGISQQIFTPADLTIKELQPDDSPYAGILGVHGSWASYDNEDFAALQLYAGCMGPCSGAEQVQKFVHEDMGRGTPPEGWDNQLDTTWLGNVNYAWRSKLFVARNEAYQPGRWANDLAVGGQIALGNAARFVEGQIEYRVGLGLPMGFTHIPDPAPRGVIQDPVYSRPGSPRALMDGWHAYLSIVLRAAAIDHVIVRDGGQTENGGYHPGFDPNENEPEALIGLHVARWGYALHVTYYRFIGARATEGPASATDWVNLSFEKRF